MDYMNPSLDPQERTRLLLNRMTAEEKIGQMIQLFGWNTYAVKEDGTVVLTDEFRQRVRQGGIGSLYGTLRADPWTGVTLETGLSPEEGARAVNDIQRYAVEQSRLGIPILFGEECSHGHMAIGATVFPVPLLLGSAWNKELYRDMCRAVALETRAQGGTATYSPVLDVVRDPRWGRTEECFGEDPYLIGELAEAAVQGLQGESLDSGGSVIATLKHFAGYGHSEGGRNAGPAQMGLRELHEVDLHPFRKAVEAGAWSVMTAYNEIDGEPCTSSRYLLHDVLRRDWGFKGFVITDCGAINMLARGHDVAEDGEQASVMSIQAGVDMEMSGYMFATHLLAACENGSLREEELDAAAGRILEAKFRLGLFERPYADPAAAAQVIGCPEHAELARELARQGIVLLKNEGAALPLSVDGGKIAVIGPNAHNVYNQLGDYTSPQPPGRVTTLLDGIAGKLGADAEERVLHAPGCRIQGDAREGFPAALECARQADAIVLALGGSSARDFSEGTIDLRTGASVVTDRDWSEMDCGEGIDRAGLGLLGVQLELAQVLRRLGKPLIVIYMNGRPIVEPWIDEHADAILEAWYPGQEGGGALADLLFGDANPSGKLTVSVPRHVGQLPVYYNGKRSRGKRYLEMDSKARYPFGYGLSYTTFAYSGLTLSTPVIAPDGTAVASVTVTNTGGRAGAEVVQWYICDKVSSVTRPAKELKGFERIVLEPGESRTVSFTAGPEQLRLLDRSLRPVVEEGEFILMAGTDSDTCLHASLHVRKGL